MGILDRDYMRRDYVPKAAREMQAPPERRGMPYWPVIIAGTLLIAGGIYVSVRYAAGDRHRPVSSRVPEKDRRPTVDSSASSIDLNTATFDQIRSIDSISEATAKAIIDGRPFKSWDELDAVHGIGPKRLETLRQHCVLGKTEGLE